MTRMKYQLLTMAMIVTICLAGCRTGSAVEATPVVTAGPTLPALIKTSLGEFMIADARLAEEVHGQAAGAGKRYLLLTLTEPNSLNLVPGDFSLEAFQGMIEDSRGEIYVTGADGQKIISTMAGWIEDVFTMGFVVPVEDRYTLYWPGNEPITIRP